MPTVSQNTAYLYLRGRRYRIPPICRQERDYCRRRLARRRRLRDDISAQRPEIGDHHAGTHVRLKEHLRLLIDPKIAAHRGRIVKNTGDGLLAEFSSVVDATRCALDVQRGMEARNSDIPPDQRIEFRIGINVGDVIEDNGDIFGDGVNIASRLEAIAKPDGICISDDAYRRLRTLSHARRASSRSN